MKGFARIIVNGRKYILLLFIGLMIFSVWGMTKVNIEYSITSYLPQDTDTKIALDVMEEEFTTYGTATVMIKNISYNKAKALHDEIKEIDGVKSFEFKNTTDYYKDSCALFNITFDGTDGDEECVAAYEKILGLLAGYDTYLSVPLVDNYADELQADINFVLILAVVIIVAVLAFTCNSFAEIPVFLITFAVAALLNMGTNFFFGTISFISNSVCVILQLALAIDYAIILSNRFSEEKKNGLKPVDAMAEALSKALPEICGSSLTTIAGLVALTTMSLRLGADLGLVLAKSIICSMITVFFFMPGILLLFGKAIDKTSHRSFVSNVSLIGKADVKLRYVFAAAFLAVVSVCTVFSFRTEYVYSQNSIDTSRPSATMKAREETQAVFGYTNQFVVLVPYGDYSVEKNIIDMVDAHEEITSALGISNVELTLNGYKQYLTDRINYKKFASLLGADESTAALIFEAYAYFGQDDTSSGLEEVAVFNANREIYTVSILQLCDCAFSHDNFIDAYLYDDADAYDSYTDLKEQVQDAEKQLIGTNYTRCLFNIDGDIESKETFALLEELLDEVKSYCPQAVFAGDSMSSYDLDKSFSTDNIKVSVLTVLFVFIILIFTLKSWGLPLPLTLTIQGAIFINFSYYAFAGTNLFFFVYLIVSSIQMGATIDYAIVLTGRYVDLRRTECRRISVINAINQAFPTILTSGTILTAAGFLIGFVVGDPLIATLGLCLGRGVVISILCVLFVLPALLYIFDKPLLKTAFKKKEKTERFSLRKEIKKISATLGGKAEKEDSNEQKL